MELCLSAGMGGLELYAVRTAAQLQTRGIDCIAVVVDNTFTAARMREQAVPTRTISKANRYLPLFSAYRLAHIIDSLQIDIVHMHWAKDLNLAVLAKRLAKRNVKLIYTRQMMLTRSKHDIYHRFLYRHVDLFLTITHELTKLAQQFLPLPAKAIQTLYYGVQKPPELSAEQRQSLRVSLQIPADTFAVGMVGRIEEHKGQHIVIAAVRILAAQGVRIHVTFVGPAMRSEFEEGLKQQIAVWQLSSHITFYGSHPNPIEIMSGFDTVVLATRKETFGLVLIEAMRNGVAVIGTNAGGVVEIIDDGETGLLFEPGNAQQLAEKLRLLAEDSSLRQALALAGKHKADKLFAQEIHYEKLVNYMKSLCNTPD